MRRTDPISQAFHSVDWPSHLESEMSEYDTYLLLLDNGEENDYLSSYCSVQRPEYFKIQ